MSVLVEFLLARLDEDEADLLELAKPVQRPGVTFRVDAHDHFARAITERSTPSAGHGLGRLLADVAAKRAIVDLHAIVHRDIGWLGADGYEMYDEIGVCGYCVPKRSHFPRRGDVPEGPCVTVRLLATAYSTHPNYQEEWRP